MSDYGESEWMGIAIVYREGCIGTPGTSGLFPPPFGQFCCICFFIFVGCRYFAYKPCILIDFTTGFQEFFVSLNPNPSSVVPNMESVKACPSGSGCGRYAITFKSVIRVPWSR